MVPYGDGDSISVARCHLMDPMVLWHKNITAEHLQSSIFTLSIINDQYQQLVNSFNPVDERIKYFFKSSIKSCKEFILEVIKWFVLSSEMSIRVVIIQKLVFGISLFRFESPRLQTYRNEISFLVHIA